MKRNCQGFHWLRILDKQFFAFIAIVLLYCPQASGTAFVVLVSGNVIVFGADGKSIDARADDMNPIGTRVEQKVLILNDRILVSSLGVGRIARVGGGEKTRIIYEFDSWIKSLPVKNTSSVQDVAEIIAKECTPIFRDEWAFLSSEGPVPIQNLSGDPSLPWVGYYIGGNEILGPEVYFVAIYVDWTSEQLNSPTITQIYPPSKGVTKYHNIFIRRNSANGGGTDQLFTTNSQTQRKYLKLYDKEVGAAIYDEPLDVEGLTKLARIMLTLEIETTPKRFDFPITVCSAVPNQRPTCNTYEH